MMSIGNDIILTGFKDLDEQTQADVRRIVETHVHTIKGHVGEKFNRVNLTLKGIHKRETSQKYDVNIHLRVDNKDYYAEFIDRNLLTTIDTVFEKVQKELEKHQRWK